MKDLKSYRVELDEIDKILIDTIAKRFQINEKIKTYKHNNGIAIYDKNREDTLIKDRKNYAIEMNISDDFIERIFRDLLSFIHSSK